jgi:replicative superfamily II helicase
MSVTSENLMDNVCIALQLPAEFQKAYANMGVQRIYDWQRDCLYTTKVLTGENLVYCAPTSGGKTLVAELVLIRTVVRQRKKVLFVLPYVSLVAEKEKYLKRLFVGWNRSKPPMERVLIRGFYGDRGGSRSYKEKVLVCTIEKANLIYNSLAKRGKLHQLGCVLLDEAHTLGSSFNGHLLEILIRYWLF